MTEEQEADVLAEFSDRLMVGDVDGALEIYQLVDGKLKELLVFECRLRLWFKQGLFDLAP